MENRLAEIAPDVYRIDWSIGTKPMASYLLAGDGVILIDSGLPDTPEQVYLPALKAIGCRPEDVRLLIITHADADHIGGNHAARGLFPHIMIACHRRDARWASDPDILTAERYDGFKPYGLRYDQGTFDTLTSWMGPAEPMDLLIQAGDRIRVAGDDWLEVHHVPGHTPGHLCLHNPVRGYALIGDAVFGRSQLDTAGNWLAPPPYDDVPAYRATIDHLRGLQADLLLTCHYPVMRDNEIGTFLDESVEWTNDAATFASRLLQESAEPVTLAAAFEQADPVLGPYQNPRELQWALRAHFAELVSIGTARHIEHDGVMAWAMNA
ncbi:MAG TPA: MBL fold metallo-hydrolase [Thermomicrobiales bacterium]|nr:MBL fold metallo-hydrolase [Thermomicrobiales bacterium]